MIYNYNNSNIGKYYCESHFFENYFQDENLGFLDTLMANTFHAIGLLNSSLKDVCDYPDLALNILDVYHNIQKDDTVNARFFLEVFCENFTNKRASPEIRKLFDSGEIDACMDMLVKEFRGADLPPALVDVIKLIGPFLIELASNRITIYRYYTAMIALLMRIWGEYVNYNLESNLTEWNGYRFSDSMSNLCHLLPHLRS